MNFRIDGGNKAGASKSAKGDDGDADSASAGAAGSAAAAAAAATAAAAAASSSSSSSSSAAGSEKSAAEKSKEAIESIQEILNLKFPPLYAMFQFDEEKLCSGYDDYGQQCDLTPYMDQFARQETTSIELLVEDGDRRKDSRGAGAGEGASTKKRWRDRMAGKGSKGDAGAMFHDDSEDDDADEDDDTYDDDDMDAVPERLVSEETQLDVACKLLYIDMEGRSDKQSLKIMIERMSPRRIALVHGSHDAASELKAALTSKETPKDDIHLPARGEGVEMRSDTKTFKIKMADTLLAMLRMKAIAEGLEVARFNAVMRYQTPEERAAAAGGGDGAAPLEDGEGELLLFPDRAGTKNNSNGKGDGQGMMVVQGDDDGDTGIVGKDGMWVSVGELKLSELRTRLQQVGIRADFQPGGVLVCEGGVAISKEGPREFAMDGVVGDLYYRVRDVIYQVLTFVPDR